MRKATDLSLFFFFFFIERMKMENNIEENKKKRKRKKSCYASSLVYIARLLKSSLGLSRHEAELNW